jgi:CheY-like chemotaxis protein
MNVLLLEDRGAATLYVVQWLESQGHKVLLAFNPNDAKSYWAKRDVTMIECIILDLNLPTDGLSKEQKERSVGGLLSGWVWLYEVVLAEAPQMRHRTIIYSDYIATLKDNVTEDKYKSITLIPKRRRSSSAREVAARIRQIGRMSSRSNSSRPLETSL